MKPGRLTLLLALTLSIALGSVDAASALSGPILKLDIHHNQTNLPPGGKAQLWFDVSNVGDTHSSGPVTLTIKLPVGQISRDKMFESYDPVYSDSGGYQTLDWSCPGSPGATTIVCTTSKGILRHSTSHSQNLSVDIAPTASGDRFVTATVSGGGAPQAPPVAGCAPGVGACAIEKTRIDPEPAGFAILPETFTPDFTEADELTPMRESGAHPDLLTVPFDLSSIVFPIAGSPRQQTAAGTLRDLIVDLPPGFLGNPTAVSECSAADFTLFQCPRSSQVGRSDVRVYAVGSPNEITPFTPFTAGVYNLSHPRGAISDLGLSVAGNPVHVRASLDAANHYAIRTVVNDINESAPVFNQKLTVWGVPAARSHDSERCPKFRDFSLGSTIEECSTDAEEKPFLTLPFQCEVDHTVRLHHYDSWQETGVFGPELDYPMPGQSTDCDKPRFDPKVEIVPTGKQANTPTGLDVHIKVAQNENPNALATPPVKSTTVRLPEGMSFSPSFADGLKSCTLAQMKLGTNEAIECPDASRIGEVELSTPLLPERLEGSMYLAAQGDNPFGSLFALYLVLHDTEERGVLVKIPGRIDVDSSTGQITTIFDETPQFPFDDLTLKFRSGPRAPLVNPPSCGSHTIGVQVTSWAQPTVPVDASNTYQVSEGPNGTPCPPDSAHRPFAPRMTAGTENPSAGAYSPFGFELSREDSEQELSGVSAVLPPGLVAKIAGVSLCPEQAIASISTAEGAGQGEAASPACPASSQVGSISAGLGAGPGPNYFPGKVYLAGPYKGAQLSLAVVAPGLAGPFDLGNVVVRAALYVNPDTTQVKAVSDPFPTMLHGVILRVRDVRLRMDRPQTMINPTNCSPMAVAGQVSGTAGAFFDTASPFQVGSCASLSFKPKLDLRLFGGTHRGSHPKLKATVTFPPGGANTASASVALPRSEFLDQGHIGTVCTRVQFNANACPAASIYGTVSAKTPLLDETLSGPIYLRSSNHQLPDLVAAFRGGRIDANLVGRVDSVNGGIRNTFEFVPDVPVTSATFSFFGGAKGLLVNSRDICKAPAKATAKFTGQNGAALTLRPPLKSACGEAKKKKHAKKRRR